MLLELKKSSSLKAESNSEWTTVIQPTILPEGTEVSLFNAFIQSEKGNTYDEITIEKDIDCVLSYVYWITNILNADDITGTSGDYEKYICKYMNQPTEDTVIGSKSIRVKAGIYSPQLLGNEVSRLLSEINLLTDPNINLLRNGLLAQTNEHILYACEYLDNTRLIVLGIVINDTIKNLLKADNEINVWYFTGEGRYSFIHLKIIVGIGESGTFSYETFNNQPGIPKDAYSIHIQKIYPTTPLYNFYKQGTPTTYFNYNTNTNYFFGASQSSLNFEDNRFSFDFLHSPLYFSQEMSVGIENNYSIDSLSGISFVELQPASFFYELLGFSEDICINPSNFLTKPNVLQPSLNITTGFFGLNAYLNKNSSGMKNTTNTQKVYSATTDTMAIETKEVWKNTLESNDGYYLLEINCSLTDTIGENKIVKNIMGIISRQYSEEGFITSYNSGSVNWIVKGQAVVLSAIKIRILDPSKLSPAVLGNNNTVYLSVDFPIPEKK